MGDQIKVYFVRHGETSANAQRITHFNSKTVGQPLSEKGRKQSEAVAHKLTEYDFELIMCSYYQRSRQTAEEISKVNGGKRVLKTHLLDEWWHPTEMDGLKIGSSEDRKIVDLLRQNADNPNYHYSDEENVVAFADRIRNMLSYVSKRKEQPIVVVMHGHVLRMALAQITLGNNFSTRDFFNMKPVFKFHHTGITECVYKDGKWKIVRANDGFHLERDALHT